MSNQNWINFLLFLCTVVILFNCTRREELNLQIDHVILAINDLDTGMEQFEKMTGIKPVYGGGHEDSYTHNATIPLADEIYIEILAPKSDLDSIPSFFKDIHELKLIGFAMAVDNIQKLEQIIKDMQFDSEGVESWSRKKPNGETLEWELLQVKGLDINPFFISWSSNTQHPSASEIIQCSLRELNLVSPNKSDILDILSKSNQNISLLKIEEGHSPVLEMTFESPKGEVVLK